MAESANCHGLRIYLILNKLILHHNFTISNLRPTMHSELLNYSKLAISIFIHQHLTLLFRSRRTLNCYKSILGPRVKCTLNPVIGHSVGKESSCNSGDPGSTPGLGRSTGEGIGYPLQYSWTSLVA